MKRIQSLLLIIILVFIMLFGVSVSAETPSSVIVGNAIGKKGDTVKIPVILAGNKGFSSLGIEIGYDASALKLINVVTDDSIGGTFTSAENLTDNPYNMGWDSARNTTFNGTIATLTFEITANTNGTYPVTVDYYKGRNGDYIDGDGVNYDENFKPLNLAYVSGSITVGTITGNISAENISTSEQTICKVTLTSDNYGGKILGALYAEDGLLLCTKTYSASSSFNIVFDKDVTGSYIKILWLDNLNLLRPICNSEIIRLQ